MLEEIWIVVEEQIINIDNKNIYADVYDENIYVTNTYQWRDE